METSTTSERHERLNVAFDASVLVGELGGPGVAFQHLLAALSTHEDVKLSVFALGLRSGDLSVRVPKGVVHEQRYLPARLTSAFWRYGSFPSVRRLCGDTDVVHTFGGVIAPRGSTPMLVTVPDATALTHEHLASAAERSRLQSLCRAMDQGVIVHTPTEAVKADLVGGLQLDARRVVVIPFGVPVLEARDQVGVDRWLPEGTDRYVIALGTSQQRKGHRFLVEAFQQLADEDPHLGLLLVGQCSTAERDELRSLRHGARMVRTGPLSSAEAATLLQSAAMLVYPSLSEGFGFPPLQAMAAGVPVIASDLPALREVAGDAALFVRAGDGGALAHAMQVLLHNSALHRDLTIRGRRRVSTMSWQATAQRFEEIYRLVHAHG